MTDTAGADDLEARQAQARKDARERIARALETGARDDPAVDLPLEPTLGEVVEGWENADHPDAVSLGASGPMAALDATTRRRLRQHGLELKDAGATLEELEPCTCALLEVAHLVADHGLRQ